MVSLLLQFVLLGAAPAAQAESGAPAKERAIRILNVDANEDLPTLPKLESPVKLLTLPKQEMQAPEVGDEIEELVEIDKRERQPLEPMLMEEEEEGSIFKSVLAPVEAIDRLPGKLLSQHPLLGNGDPEMTVTAVPRNLLTVILGPVREANLLLPRRLDPFDEEGQGDELASDEADFSPAKQREFLGTGLSSRKNPNAKDAKWSWLIETGGSFRQGNTSNTNLRSNLRTERHTIYSDIMARVAITYNRNGDDDINRQALSEFNIDRNLRGRWVGYAREYLEYDQARLINLRTVTSSGLGFKFINRLRSRLIVRTGPTVSYITYAPEAEQDAEFRSGWLLESDYRRLIWETVRVEWTCSAFPDFDSEQQFRVRNEAALLFPIGGKTSPWNWKLGVQHDYQLNPVENTKPSDVFGYFSIAYTR